MGKGNKTVRITVRFEPEEARLLMKAAQEELLVPNLNQTL